MKESDYKNFLKAQFNGFSCSVEFGIGARAGFPDLLFHSVDTGTFLVEAKLGELKNDELKFTEVRREQFSWLRDFCSSGGKAFLFVGVRVGKSWVTFVLPPPVTRKFKNAIIKKAVRENETFRIDGTPSKADYSYLLEWERICLLEKD